jgi:hypothetical protein
MQPQEGKTGRPLAEKNDMMRKKRHQGEAFCHPWRGLDRASRTPLCSAMTRTLHPLALLRRIGLVLMLLPFGLLALIPAAAMPMQGADGRIVMVLCTTDGRVDVLFDPATGEVSEVPTKAPGTCDWAAATGIAVLADAPPLAARPRVLTQTPPAPQQFAYAPAHDPRGVYARGPPTLT